MDDQAAKLAKHRSTNWAASDAGEERRLFGLLRKAASRSLLIGEANIAVRGGQRDLKRLRICMSDSGCITAWLDETSHGWSISKGIEADFEKSVIDLDGHETSAWGD